MRLATAADIVRMDERAEKEYGIPRMVLMENAGASVVLAMERTFGSLEGKKVTVFCGKGGNGGDGMCAARHLISHGASVAVGLVGGREGIKGETLANWTILDKMEMRPQEILGQEQLGWVRAAASAADYVVDALLGTSARLPVSGLLAEVVKAVNESGRKIVAVDAPSGLDVDTGQVKGPCVRAALTVTLGLPKRGLVLYPGALFAGKLVVTDLTFPLPLLTDPAVAADILLEEEAAELVPSRRPQAHKHEVGRVLVAAGSKDMTGAALLAAEGALVGGAGIVYVAAPASAAGLMHGRRLELILKPQPETPAGAFGREAAAALLKEAGQVQAAAVGPGIGLGEETRLTALEFVRKAACPVVIDADALTALASEPESLAGSPGPRIITPHSGEMGRLLNISSEQVEANRLGAAKTAAGKFGSVVVLKGARTVVAEPGGRVFVIPTGNAGMATGGTGDVLAGLLAALLAQRLPALSAALLGAYSHGLAGDLAREDKTELSLSATDLVDYLPKAFKRLASGGAGGGAILESIKGGNCQS